MVKEVLRWRPAFPLSIPHSATDDDWYNGVFISKGTLCLATLWHCRRDTSYYGDDAANFRPERFLDAHGEIIPGPAETHEEGHGTYGFGKRACAWKHVAYESLFIYIATALWEASLKRARDQDGNEVPLDTEAFVDTGMVCMHISLYAASNLSYLHRKPAPYECKIVARFPEELPILAAGEEVLRSWIWDG
ncbi:cytochrome P450 [Lactarius psammicola]|nr:cytochrome P450 [Lactarius psammicola]